MHYTYKGDVFRYEVFKTWLEQRGAMLLEPTNDYEVLRWYSNQVTNIIYRNDKNEITSFVNEAKHIYESYLMGRGWNAGVTTCHPTVKKKNNLKRSIISRDGENCWFCGCALSEDEQTLEHLVARINGGPNHISNTVIACRPCNMEAGNISVSEKVKYREEKRMSAIDLTTDPLRLAVAMLQSTCHGEAKNAGWWTNPDGTERKIDPNTREGIKELAWPLLLIISEVIEASEGARKKEKDDKLHHRDMLEVELADALIRIFDLSGAMNLDLAGAVVEKLEYNRTREDHKPENRQKEGGKVF